MSEVLAALEPPGRLLARIIADVAIRKLLFGVGGRHLGEVDSLGFGAGWCSTAAACGFLVRGVAHGLDGCTEGERGLEELAAEDFGDLTRPLCTHPVSEPPVVGAVPVLLVEVLELCVAAPVDEEVAEHGGDAGESVEGGEAAALLALELLDAAFAGVGELGDGDVLLG